jgi:hypothetical protein
MLLKAMAIATLWTLRSTTAARTSKAVASVKGDLDELAKLYEP